MKKNLTFLMAILFAITFVSCGEDEKDVVTTTEIDTGIPDVVMMIEDNLTEDKYAPIGDNRIQYVNSDGKEVSYKRWDSDGNTELEKYYSYHNDGRLYQELVKFYKNRELFRIELKQYEFEENSKDAVVTMWLYDHEFDKVQTDSVICTMTTTVSDLYCNSIQENPLEIRGVEEYHYGMRLGHIKFLAGKQIEE